MTNSPPRPRLTLSVGVTGHRPNKLAAADLPVLHRAIRDALSMVQQSVQHIAVERAADYTEQPPLLRIISSLAEGADRIVTEEALALGFELQVVLPYAAELHRPEFSTPTSYTEFEALLTQATAALVQPGMPRAANAYEQAGLAMLQHADVLLTVWDGETASGVGGTGEIVLKAVDQGIPVIHIESRPPHALLLLETAGEGTRLTDQVNRLPERIAELLIPPSRHNRRGVMVADLRETYFRETALRGRLGRTFGVVTNIASGRMRVWPRLLPDDYVKATMEQWRSGPPLPDALVSQLEGTFLTPYAWADNLATYYANRSRSTFTWTFMLAPIAVVAALFDYFAEPRHVGPTAWVVVELVSLLTILALYRASRRGFWHERWLDYRSLAERLRQLTFLWPLDCPIAAPAVLAHHAGGDPRTTWVGWYIRGIVRQAGVFNGLMDADHVQACRSLLLDRVLHGQIAYHRGNARMYTVQHRLHVVATTLFGGAILACVAHFVGPVIPGLRKEILTLMAAGLPACGAAVHGFLSQGDFQNVARRSEGMRASLEDLAYRVERAGDLATLRTLAQETADVVGAELIDWRVGFEGKPPTLPG